LSGRFDARVDPLSIGGHVKFWSRRTLTVLFNEQGFQVDSFIGAGRLPGLWKSMILTAARR
jgi:2-polyprenyl-6-hydroxyphenyl methylase/3-demethylubiquinone-9 3-methyltransferase